MSLRVVWAVIRMVFEPQVLVPASGMPGSVIRNFLIG